MRRDKRVVWRKYALKDMREQKTKEIRRGGRRKERQSKRATVKIKIKAESTSEGRKYVMERDSKMVKKERHAEE